MDTPIRVLYVHGDPERRRELRDVLEDEVTTVEVRSEPDATGALSRLERDPGSVDCVVSPYRLPDADGIAFRRELGRRVPDSVPPFVLFLEDGSESIAAEALEAGVTGYVRSDRPDALATLAKRIRHAVECGRSGGSTGPSRKRSDVHTELRWERERLEEVRRVVSHDLRSPLNVATGYLQHASRESDGSAVDRESRTESEGETGDGRTDESIRRALDALDRLASFVGDLNALVRQGTPVEDLESVDLAATARTSWEGVETGDATLRVDCGGNVWAESDRLSAIFRELYRNAVEHAGSEVTVEVGDLPSGFYLEDDGPGIPKPRREDVLDAGVSDLRNRTGFGLAKVRHVAAAHGWKVSVSEGSDGGTRVEFTGVHGPENGAIGDGKGKSQGGGECE